MGGEFFIRSLFVTYFAHKRGLLGILIRGKTFTMTRRLTVKRGLSSTGEVEFVLTRTACHGTSVSEVIRNLAR